jgi:hypothetical protein
MSWSGVGTVAVFDPTAKQSGAVGHKRGAPIFPQYISRHFDPGGQCRRSSLVTQAALARPE